MNPFIKFQYWYLEELDQTDSNIPSACCLSTLGTDGYPNARFVSLKEVRDEQFIVTGPMNSRKGREIEKIPRAALTFWWPVTQKQVRIQGDVLKLDPAEADRYFQERPADAQIVSLASEQGRHMADPEALETRFSHLQKLYENKAIPRPYDWGGFAIIPVRMEFLLFSESRFHERVLYSRNGKKWEKQGLQP